MGAAGGVAGTLAMPYVTSALYKRESEEKKAREEQARKEPPFRVLAGRVVELFGLAPTDTRTTLVGQVVHWGYGMAWGALYGVLRRRYPLLARSWGLPFALAFTLLGDEAMNTLMGLTAPPRHFPVDAHLRGLAGHIAFTAAAEGAVRTLSAATP
jgi:uncharacterized membrane protein YagU involved in acid resistance